LWQLERPLQQTHGQSDGEQPGEQRHRDGQARGGQLVDRVRHEQHLHADQHEQHRVQYLVDQLPEHVQIAARGVRYRQRAAVVADDQARADHRQRTGHMQSAGQGVAWRCASLDHVGRHKTRS